MKESDAPLNINNVEVSVGWNSSSPKADFPFPDSVDSGDTPMKTPKAVPRAKERGIANTGILGNYSTLLPGSSPPRPRRIMRKRKPESPLKPSRKTALSSVTADTVPFPAPPAMEQPSKRTMSLLTDDDDDDADDNDDDNDDDDVFFDVPKQKLAPSVLESDGEDDTDSDLEDLMQMHAPLKFVRSYFTNRRVLRLVVQRVEASPTALTLRCTDSLNADHVLRLEDSWTETKVTRGDIVHLCNFANPKRGAESVGNTPSTTSSFSASTTVSSCTLTDKDESYLIVNPDILVPCTSVAEALACERQVILRSQVRVPADLNANLVLGSIKHEFIQSCFTTEILSSAGQMQEALRTAAEAYTLDLQLVDMDVPTAVDKLQPLVPQVQRWALAIWGPRAAGKFADWHRGSGQIKVRLDRAAYIEEEIRSTILGLVGKIDVTCEATELQARGSGGGAKRLTGLEIKTGKNTQSISHKAQTSLYTLLLAERHPYNTHPWSLLYYSETGTTIAVVAMPAETRALLQKRNKVAHDMWQLPPGALPAPTVQSEVICNWCARKDSCIIYTAVAEQGNTWQNSALTNIFTKAQTEGKLAPSFLRFLEHWHMLLDMEYEISKRNDKLRSRQWWLNAPDPVMWNVSEQDESMPLRGFVYKLATQQRTKSGNAEEPVPHFGAGKVASDAASTVQVTLKPEDYVIVSTKQHMGITFGVVLEASATALKICVHDKLLQSGKYRVDAEPWAMDTHLGLAKFNLNSLIEKDRLRELVVDLSEPKFAELSSRRFQSTVEWASNKVLSASQEQDLQSLGNGTGHASTSGSGSGSRLALADVHRNLNEDQSEALNKVLSARDYTMILGMPGTGKTTTIAAIVAALVDRGKSVLLSAYTNSAVDTIVLKLISAKVRCVRLATARKEAVHPEVLPVSVFANSTDSGGTPLTDFLESPVIACTSHSANNKLFALREFDYCILDEASQITLPFSLGPLRLASTFVLVGDHYQLPPLVRNQQAKDLGLADSLFKILCEAHPSAVVELRRQYRMCQDIMSLSSDLVYNGRLVCGSEAVANQKLELSVDSVDAHILNAPAIDPNRSVVFLSTDKLGRVAYEQVHADGRSNQAEVRIIESLVHQFAVYGVDMKNMAVISVYRQQLAQLNLQLHDVVAKGLEILTADQAQGRDKQCIIVSLVRSNEHSHSGELLKDWRRLNVAFTRAKQKLVIVGSRRTMQQAEGVTSFFEYIERRGWVYDAALPETV